MQNRHRGMSNLYTVEMEQLHELLKEQVASYLPEGLAADPAMQDFLKAVSTVYNKYDTAAGNGNGGLSTLEQELLRTRQALLEAQQSAAIGSFEIDLVARSSQFTRQAASLLGFSSEDLVFSDELIPILRTYVFKEDLERIDECWADAMKNRSDIRLDLRVRHPDGNIYTLHWIVKTSFSETGRLIKVGGTLQDITERVQQEQQLLEYAQNLEKINKELDQFAYIVSHDLKAPLRAITNLSEWIEEDLAGKADAETSKNFEMLRSRIRRMESLIDGVLQYSRAGRAKTETQPINLSEFVQDIVANLSPPEQFTVHVQENMPVLNCEKIAVEQVFSNFISNAIKYNTAPAPEIRIRYADFGLFHRFCVEDNGPGIDPQFHEKVFMIFQTLQSRDVVDSTGVGLAIVKKIVEEKAGRVWVESELGKGARFYFTIPKN